MHHTNLHQNLQYLALERSDTNAASMIKLNIGGLKINTTQQVLLRNGENYFAKLLSGQIPVLRDDEDYIFLDRNGKVFQVILDYLRHGTLFVPSEMSATQVREELLYYYPNDALPLELARKESEVNELTPRTTGVYWRKKSELNHVIKLRLIWFTVAGEICFVDDTKLLQGRATPLPHQPGWLAFDWSNTEQSRALGYINQGTLYHRFETHWFMNCSPPLHTEYRMGGTVLTHYPGPRYQPRTVDRFRVTSPQLIEVQYAPSEEPVQFGYTLEWREGLCYIAVPQFYQYRDIYAFSSKDHVTRTATLRGLVCGALIVWLNLRECHSTCPGRVIPPETDIATATDFLRP